MHFLGGEEEVGKWQEVGQLIVEGGGGEVVLGSG